ncbi:hypothetical protein CDEST_15167 [Colletotrichum destructivum]|uniref:DUF7136 domain-containing protein n=1 Tax=Colletotrichum destructivum TaxID=34406 RepID=A0AAX4J448_9PEZI|nr:hypothetical protein CDEST_15167 [Colletotrichum destructivum]
MLLRVPLSSLLALFLAILAQAERRLPANLQVDLLFPRNETYAPTQWFPIVLGIQNLDALWPLDIGFNLEVLSMEAWKNNSSGGRADWQHVNLRPNLYGFPVGLELAPVKLFLHYPVMNMTNGTTDSFNLRWGITFVNRCFANNSLDYGGNSWSSGGNSSMRQITFSTAPGGQTPDVAATVDSCPEGGQNSTVVRVNEVRKTWGTGDQCPVFETDVEPARCAYREVAQELAANVSAAILRRMRCEEGTWQNITSPCVPKDKESGATLLTGLQRDSSSWALVLGLALAAYYNVF